MWAKWWALWALVGVSATHRDHDFHFIDDKAQLLDSPSDFQDPYTGLCSSLRCVPPARCVVSASPRPSARCADPNDVVSHSDNRRSRDDEVYYEWSENDINKDLRKDNCLECSTSGPMVCGSDGRSYSSLCALDLHNCRHSDHNPVTLVTHGPCRRAPVTCNSRSLADRLLDWFSVVMEAEGGTPPEEKSFPRECKAEVRWMFSHLDTDGDGVLSADNLYALRHDSRESCLRPFLSRCSHPGGVVSRSPSRSLPIALSRSHWCRCMRHAERPCKALKRAHMKKATGGYTPSCDNQGYFLPRQCDSQRCWCVTSRGGEVLPSAGEGRNIRCAGEVEPQEGEGEGDDEDDVGSGGGE